MSMQIRLTMTTDQIAAERRRSQSRHAMTTDAYGVPATKALRVGGTRQPRIYSRASACISYYAEDKSDAVIFREAPKDKRVRAAKNLNIPAHRITAADLRPIFAD